MKKKFAIIGCGRLGTSLGVYLKKSGFVPAGFADIRKEQAEKSASLADCSEYSDHPSEISIKADIVYICTPDGLIEETCRNISDENGFLKHSIVMHCSGAHPSSILDSAKRCGAFTASMHPLQSFTENSYNTNPFKDIIFSVEGEPSAVTCAKEIIKKLGAESIEIKTDGKPLYHAAAVVASNCLVTLLNLSYSLMEGAGVQRKNAFQMLSPLISGTLTNIEHLGIEKALTGPVIRGDIPTLRKHLEKIQTDTPGMLHFYRTLCFYTVDIAMANGSLDQETGEKIRELMDPLS